jgi:hypothetical protein
MHALHTPRVSGAKDRWIAGLLRLVTGGGCVGDVTVQLAGMLDLLTIGGGNCIAGFGWLTFFFHLLRFDVVFKLCYAYQATGKTNTAPYTSGTHYYYRENERDGILIDTPKDRFFLLLLRGWDLNKGRKSCDSIEFSVERLGATGTVLDHIRCW